MATWLWLHTKGDIRIGIQGGDRANNASIGEIFMQGNLNLCSKVCSEDELCLSTSRDGWEGNGWEGSVDEMQGTENSGLLNRRGHKARVVASLAVS